ncbi:protein takeout [Halyomorpha halys]|uniref:protein takeout n=1 Tax=Halyomorpha halys TaxID=286706 RepID=UPI0006D50079|nr:protein takeout-like [Halyomorpha halys]
MSPVFFGSIILLFFTPWTKSQKICSMKDKDVEKCLVESVQEVISVLVKGLPKYGVFPLDPLHIDILDLSDAPGKTLNVKHKFKNVDLFGLGSSNVKKVSINQKKTEIKVDAIMNEPIILTGFYESEGKLLSFPIKGDGRFNITLVNLKAELTMSGHETKKNDKVYIRFDTVRFPFTVDRLVMNFENLLKGNKEISESLNNILNENWEPILEDMRDSFEAAIGAAFKEIANRVFSKVPISDLIRDY